MSCLLKSGIISANKKKSSRRCLTAARLSDLYVFKPAPAASPAAAASHDSSHKGKPAVYFQSSPASGRWPPAGSHIPPRSASGRSHSFPAGHGSDPGSHPADPPTSPGQSHPAGSDHYPPVRLPEPRYPGRSSPAAPSPDRGQNPILPSPVRDGWPFPVFYILLTHPFYL